jgi:hypothetical protein
MGCGDGSYSHQLRERWNPRNDPRIMGIDEMTAAYRYTTKFDQLALQGRITAQPWSDSYWPTYRGGITYRWQRGSEGDNISVAYPLAKASDLTPEDIKKLSPAEKFDLYTGDEVWSTVIAERARTRIFKPSPDGAQLINTEIQSWEGLCHAWAPAAILFSEPRPVEMTSKSGVKIPFGAADVKALLSYFVHHTVRQVYLPFVGQRCEKDFSKLEENVRATEKESIECRDMNAGAFHLILVNQIAKLDQSFVVDVTRDIQVWNQPVSGFSTRVLSTSNGASPGAAPGTQKEVSVETKLDYINETGEQWSSGITAVASRIYQYRLELDGTGQIIGGAWISDDRPDFAWRQTKPAFFGKWLAVEQIYNASIAAPLMAGPAF